LIPLTTALVVAALGPRWQAAHRWLSLAATVITATLAVVLAINLAQTPIASPTGPAPPTFAPQFVTQFDLLQLSTGHDLAASAEKPGAIQFFIGLDGLNVWLVVLTAVLMVPAVLVSWHSSQVQERTNEYYAWLLALETGMIGVFLAFDIILFYIFFELTLVPLFFLIGVWGGPARRDAARKFFIYTLTGSLITLLGLIGVVVFCYNLSGELTFSIPRLVQLANELFRQPDAVEKGYLHVQFWIFLAIMAGFAVKVPLVPLHTWLPLAHVEAPTAGSVLLAGVLLKIGAYGFLRLCLPLVPDASISVGVPLIGTLAVIGIIYGALTALVQDDIKKLVAYSSVSHLGFCMLGMFALNSAGLSGCLLQMVNHGLSTGGLFLIVGMLYERYHTRHMNDYGGMAARLKLLSLAMVFICLTSIGLPGLNGFVGEVLVFLGMYQYWPELAVIGTAGIVLGAWYLLRLLQKVFFGPLKEPAQEGHAVNDLNLRELAALAPIAILCVWIGVFPQPFLQTAQRDLDVVAALTQEAKDGRPAKPAATAQTPKPAVAQNIRGEEPR
jgi:NADH-quinone oxidoreductase subunit M